MKPASFIVSIMLALAAAACAAAPRAAAPALQPATASYNDTFGAFSPDGGRIVFTSDRSGDLQIMLPMSTALDCAIDRLARSRRPSGFLADGELIAFQSPRDGGDVQIYLMRRDGTGQRRLVPTTGFCGVPVWSPSGRRLAFQCSPDLVRFGTVQCCGSW